MSLLKWKELATKTSKLGIKINYVHDTILKTKLGEKTSQTSTLSIQTNYHYQLGDVIVGSLKLFLRKRQQLKKLEVRNYGIDINDEVPDYGLVSSLNSSCWRIHSCDAARVSNQLEVPMTW